MPEIGLLELPTRPTVRAETAAKKNPKSAIISAPPTPTGTAGTQAMKTMTHAMPAATLRNGMSPPAAKPFVARAALNVREKSGKERTSERNPPAAIAPAPT